MGFNFAFGWEIPFMVWLQSFTNGFTVALAKFFTICGEEYVMILVLGIAYWCVDKELGRRVALALSGTIVCGAMLKAAVLRRRPYMDHSEVQCIRAAHPEQDIMSVKEQGFSFPSLHAAMSATTYGAIAINVRKKWTTILAIALPLLIGLSRPFLGVHYPTDVLVGWALGVVMVLVFNAVEKKIGYFKAFVILLVVGAFGFLYCTDSEFSAGYGVALGALLGFWIEEKFVHFTYCKKWWSYILRPLFGVLVFLLISSVLKLPVKGMTLEDGGMPLLLYRTFRYAVSAAVTLGVYPALFKAFGNRF